MLETVYNEHDNRISLLLKASTINDPVLRVKTLENVTRMAISNKNRTIDSQEDATPWDWTTLQASGIVTIKLGLEKLQADKETPWTLYVYDATNPNGIRWGSFRIKVESSWL